MSRLLNVFLSLKLAIATLTWLMILTFVGTLYQAEHGLFAAQEKFYNSWIFILGFVPLPGAQFTLAVLFLNLLAALIWQFQLGWRRVGLLILHLGLLLLLAGGFVTHYFGEESFLSLQEGESNSVSLDYRNWELSVWEGREPLRNVQAYDLSKRSRGQRFMFPDWSMEVEAIAYHKNCRAFTGGEQAENIVANPDQITTLEPQPENRDPEADIPGGVFAVQGLGEGVEKMLLYGGQLRPTSIKAGDREFHFALRKKRYPLPLTVRLLDFEKAFHPNSQIPRSFSSQVMVNIQGVEREAHIKMNEPFRYLGYTFFQASYAETDTEVEVSTFAITRNYGRLIPYVATGVTFVGLVIHFLVMLLSRKREEEKHA